MPSYCTICKTREIAEHDGVLGACMYCADTLLSRGKRWVAMVTRFLRGKPKPGENFTVVREVAESTSEPGTFVALESIGSNLASARLARAERYDSEDEARKALGI